MKIAKKTTTKKTALVNEDWAFADFFESADLAELEAATIYEYARELAFMHDRVRLYTSLPDEWKREADDECRLDPFLPPDAQDLFLFTAYPYWNCILWPEWFPQTPWLKIPHDTRIQRMNAYRVLKQPVLIAREDFCTVGRYDDHFRKDGKAPQPDPSRRIYTAGGECVLLFVNWSAADNKALAAAFKAWLPKNRPPKLLHQQARGFRRTNRESPLRWLATARLLMYYEHRAALELVRAHANAGLIDERMDNAYRSRRKAVEAFRRNNKSWDFPDEQPLFAPDQVSKVVGDPAAT